MAVYADFRLELGLDGTGAKFDPAIFDPAIFDTDIGWTNVSGASDVRAAEPIVCEYGIRNQASPTDRVAEPGELMFALNNSEFNSALTRGYYSFLNALKRSGFDLNIPVRFSLNCSDVAGGTRYYKFRGTLSDAPPDAGIYGPRLTRCTAVDWFDDAMRIDEPDIVLQIDQRVDQIFTALIDGMSTQPTATDVEQGSDVLPIAIDGGTGQKLKVRERINQLCQTEFGYCYPIGDTIKGGTVRLENRYHRLSNPSSMFTFDNDMDRDGLPIRGSRDDIYKNVRVIVHPTNNSAAASIQVVFSMGNAAVGINPGMTNDTIFGPYLDPVSHTQIGARDTIDPVATTDYTMNTAPDGSGTDLTAFFAVTAARTGLGVRFTIVNNGTQVGYVTLLQVRGRPIFRFQLFLDQAVDGSYGDQLLEFDMPQQSSADVGALISTFLSDALSTPAARLHELRFLANRSATYMAAALQLEPGDRITVSEDASGIDAAELTINGVRLELRPGGILFCTWYLEPASTHQYFLLDAIGAAEVGQLTVATPSGIWNVVEGSVPHEFGGTNQTSRNEAAYPAGATLDKLSPNTDVVSFDSASLPAGTYVLVATLATDGGGTATLALVNLTDADTTAMVSVSSTSATGQQVTSGAVTFAAAGASKTYAVKLKVTAGNAWAWGIRLVRTA